MKRRKKMLDLVVGHRLPAKNINLKSESPHWECHDNQSLIMTEWRMLVKLGLLKVKDSLMQEIMAVREKFFAPIDRVLGVRPIDWRKLVGK